MPHLHVIHTKGIAAHMPELLAAMHDALLPLGFGSASIKAYNVELGHAIVNGVTGAEMAHLTFRLLQKEERTPDVLRDWLTQLQAVMLTHLPKGCSVTVETQNLPPIYFSATA